MCTHEQGSIYFWEDDAEDAAPAGEDLEVSLFADESFDLREGVTLRFYGEEDEQVRVILDPTDGDRMTETEGKWDNHGYWFVPYVSEGNYVVIR